MRILIRVLKYVSVNSKAGKIEPGFLQGFPAASITLVACNGQSCTDPGDGSRNEARPDEGVIARSMATTSNAASMCETRPGSIDLAVTGH